MKRAASVFNVDAVALHQEAPLVDYFPSTLTVDVAPDWAAAARRQIVAMSPAWTWTKLFGLASLVALVRTSRILFSSLFMVPISSG